MKYVIVDMESVNTTGKASIVGTYPSAAEAMKANGTITKGMIPKIDNAFKAINNGVKTVVIGHAGDIKQIAQKQKGYGTYIR